ncbi:SH3 and cysteine-rich domain-containing protein 3-like isoform X1 [Fundulus heteroclitus]|uniref:SH3 and cysteine-rich domain-containing protein 3-like isoform X1 n=1 Tax=Fundulus heteroclitus TaxID=8078 RepID=UPI00165BCD83|nr:SH3 and cysteine-rich domain-containing protein 3-like isoform X1 [Fundulus heteroclitus]
MGLWNCARMGCTVSFICCEEDFLQMPLYRHEDEEKKEPEELEALHSHTFRVKTFKKTKHCSACKQTIVQDGLVCRVCRIACHKKCEAKVRVRTILTSSRFSVPKGSKCLV